jgi:CBS domain containing-hemolysin-like protein
MLPFEHNTSFSDYSAYLNEDRFYFITSINTAEEDDIDTTLFQNALYMHTLKVRECMIPRNEIESIDINESIEDLRQLFIKTRLSRLLVYKDNIDYIEGYVHHQRLFENPKRIQDILWKIPMVHEFTPAQDVMNQLIKEKLNLAWVVDERGGTAGIVALEDILEEIFGEIEDEHDFNDSEVKINDNEYIFSGRNEIDIINEDHSWDIPESDEYNTLSGLIVTVQENIPEQGEKITLGNYEFIVELASNTKIDKVRVIKLPDNE